MLQNFKLKQLLYASKSVEKIVQLNFYHAVLFLKMLKMTIGKKYILYGFDFLPLIDYNLHVHI